MLSFISPFFFNDTATTEIYTLSLHDALPISLPARRAPLSCRARRPSACAPARGRAGGRAPRRRRGHGGRHRRSEEHTSELQSPCNLVCRLLLEKKNRKTQDNTIRRRTETHKI